MRIALPVFGAIRGEKNISLNTTRHPVEACDMPFARFPWNF
jgi:hypothetical protein